MGHHFDVKDAASCSKRLRQIFSLHMSSQKIWAQDTTFRCHDLFNCHKSLRLHVAKNKAANL